MSLVRGCGVGMRVDRSCALVEDGVGWDGGLLGRNFIIPFFMYVDGIRKDPIEYLITNRMGFCTYLDTVLA